MKQISRESPPTVPIHPRVSSNFYAMLQYSMTNKVSHTRRCCSQAESSMSMMTSQAIAVHVFFGKGWWFCRRRLPSQPSCSKSDGDDWIIQHSQALSLCYCVCLQFTLPCSLRHVTCALIQNNSSSFSPGAPPVATPFFRDTFTVKCSWLLSVSQESVAGFML